MRIAINRNIEGTRLQGARHGNSRVITPIKKDSRPSVCVRRGCPEYPAEDIYVGKRTAKKC